VKEGIKNIGRRIAGKRIRFLSYTYYYEAYYREMVSFFDCIRNDTESPVSAVEGLKTVEIIQSAYEKANQKSA
jgi:predicted dehydrogenase